MLRILSHRPPPQKYHHFPSINHCLSRRSHRGSTPVVYNSQHPVWNQHFTIPLAHRVTHIEFHVKENDTFGAAVIGVATVPVDRFSLTRRFPIIGPYGKPVKTDCSVHIEMKFTPCEDEPVFKFGFGSDFSVKNSYFPIRHGGHVTLYKDAYVPDGRLPEIELEDGCVFRHDKCWEDICHAILEAHHLVYIVGWSVYHQVKLVREATKPLLSGGNLNLGELLKYKLQEGVWVLLLVCDDKTSHKKFFIKTAGVMQTHNEETRKFFKHSSVNCVLSPRYASSKLSIFKQKACFILLNQDFRHKLLVGL